VSKIISVFSGNRTRLAGLGEVPTTGLIRLQEAVSAVAPVAPISRKNPRRFIKYLQSPRHSYGFESSWISLIGSAQACLAKGPGRRSVSTLVARSGMYRRRQKHLNTYSFKMTSQFTQLRIRWNCQRMDAASPKLDSCTYPPANYRQDRSHRKQTAGCDRRIPLAPMGRSSDVLQVSALANR